MKTYLIGDEDVARYSRDIADRLSQLGENFPAIWCTLGISGEKIAAQVGDHLPPAQQEALATIRLTFDRNSGAVAFDDPTDEKYLCDHLEHPVLVIDSSVHSGYSMREVTRKLQQLGLVNISSYALVLKRGSSFIPSYFGLLIDDTDRALFQLDKYPTNRLFKTKPFGILRKLCDDDANLTPDSIDTGVPSIDKTTFGDLLYDRESQSAHVYLYELGGKVCGFLSFKTSRESVMFIDGLAAAKDLHGQGVGGMLLRWAETWARSANYRLIELWSISNRMDFYKKAGFKIDDSKQPLQLGHGEVYRYMYRELLYNMDLDDGE